MRAENISRETLFAANQYAKEREYWLNTLSGELVKSSFPFDDIADGKEKQEKNDAPAVPFKIHGELFSKLMTVSNNSNSRLYMLLVTGMVVLLAGYSGHDDIIIGAPINKQEIEGEFINTVLALRSRIKEGMTFRELLMQVRQTVVEAADNQNFPIETLPGELGIPGEPGGGFPLFDTAIVLENIQDKRYLEHLKINTVFSFIKTDKCIESVVRYNASCYKKGTIERIIAHFLDVLGKVFIDVDTGLDALDILLEDEKKRLLIDFNDTGAEYPGGKTLHRLFEEQVERTPHHTAVLEPGLTSGMEDRRLTYRELNEKANQLAHRLVEKGAKEGAVVCVMGKRQLEIMVGILAVLKTGAAYLPLDAQNPAGRNKFIIDDSKALLFLTQEHLLEKNAELWKNIPPGNVINLDDKSIFSGKTANPEVKNNPRALAYVIYTSGTTGEPKGVMIEHRSAVNYLCWAVETYVKGEPVNFPVYTSISFDLTVTSMFTPLITGNAAVLYGGEHNEIIIERIIEDNNVGIIKLTPSHLYLIKDKKVENSSLKSFIAGGEILDTQLARTIHENFHGKVDIYNEYGPTEATVGCMIYKYDPLKDKGRTVPIGKPVNNTRVYILDKRQMPVPIGAVGELHVSGDGVSRGYLERPRLTDEKFTSNPFSQGERLYRTGDLARWQSDGNIDCLGRADHQEKIRGFRVELGEIETRLLDHEKIKNAVVIARDMKEHGAEGYQKSDKTLCAYIVADKEPATQELKEYLSLTLPGYMIPSYFTLLEEIPLTAIGKVDKEALPRPDISSEIEYTAPRDEIERKLTEIWAATLDGNAERIGIDDNYFDLGGHSLKATVLVAKIHRELDVKLKLAEIFKYPTIREQALFIKEEAAKETFAAIAPAKKKDYYPLSSAQKRLYILQEIEEGNNINYNVAGAFEMEGELDIPKLEAALRDLIRRHEAFRTSFTLIDGQPVQVIHDDVPFAMEYHELNESGSREMEKKIITNFVRPFDLSKAPLLRAGIIKTGAQRHIFMADMHHIVSDGVSVDIFLKDFMALYEGRQLPELTVQYKDYSEWQNSERHRAALEKEEIFWLKEFEDDVPVLELAYDYPRPAVQRYEGSSIHVSVGRALKFKLKELEKSTDATLFMIMMAAFNILLMRYSGREDIITGTLNTGRPHIQMQDIIGAFINTLPMRGRPGKRKTTGDFLEEVKATSLEVFENSNYQYEELLEKLQISRNTGRNPLFDTMFILQNVDIARYELEGLAIRQYQMPRNIALLDLRVEAAEKDEELGVHFEYSTNLFKRETIERMGRHFVNILEAMAGNTKKELIELEMMTEEEKKQILVDFNNLEADFPRGRTIYQFIESRARQTPQKTAILFEGSRVTYETLNRGANQLARVLKKHGIKEDEPVGILLERSPLMVSSILATWKAGGAYIPIDTGYPFKRIHEVLEDSGAEVLISQSVYMSDELEKLLGDKVIKLDARKEEIEKESTGDLALPLDTHSLAYVIYTSGSTGKPKGAMVEHIGMMNHIQAKINDLRLTADSIVAQNASHTFDISVWQFFVALVTGGTTVIYPEELILEPGQLISRVIRDRVTILEVVPSYLSVMLNVLDTSFARLDHLNYLLVTGEEVKPLLVRKWFEKYPGIKMVNAYGPTEASDDITHLVMDESYIPNNSTREWIPIGKPLQNLNIYVLDEDMKLCPVGVKGEICVSGVGVGRGYLNDEVRTKEVFMDDPFSPEKTRLYKTGDVGCWLPDGTLRFFGRKDYQVKIRGFRIECGEIENRLLQYPGVREAVVVDGTGQGGHKYLCAYLAAEDEPDDSGIKNFLAASLPDYMVPSYFVNLKAVPLTSNGKVDRKALPAPDLEAMEERVKPADEIEERLVEIWSELLDVNIDTLDVNTGFFEIGGHSLKAIMLITKIHKEFQRKIALTDIFHMPTIRGIAGHLRKGAPEEFAAIEPAPRQDYYPLSAGQKRLYVLEKTESLGTSYHLTEAVSIEGALETEKLEEVFRQLIKRHEIFRTSFEIIEGEPVQKIHPHVAFAIEYLSPDLTGQEIIESFVRPYDLSRPPLLRAGLVRIHEEKHLLVIDMHHIISDGVSLAIFVEEFIALYKGDDLPRLNLQYKDYSAWQNRQENCNDHQTAVRKKREDAYWLNEFAGEIPVLKLPLDYERPGIKSFEGAGLDLLISQERTEALRALAIEENTTLFVLLFSIFNVLLAKISGQQDIVVGTPVGGRQHADLEKMMGMFVNTLALRNYPKKGQTFGEFLQDVNRRTLAALENQGYQFENLVKKLPLTHAPSRNPLFDVLFAMQNTGAKKVETPGLRFTSHRFEKKTTQFDLLLNCLETGGALLLTFQYCGKLFNRAKIERLANYFEDIVSIVIGKMDIKLEDIHVSHELIPIEIKERKMDFGF